MSARVKTRRVAEPALVDQVAATAGRWERREVLQMLEKTRLLSADPVVNLVVIGETKRGKSRFINALIGAPVCPVDADVASNTFVSLGHAPEPHARVYGPDWSDGLEIEVDDVARWASEHGNATNDRGVERIHVGLPSPLLATGIRVIDTPGVGGLSGAHRQVSLAALAWADALIFVLDPDGPISRPERDFLALAAERIGSVIFVLTKIDLYMDWQTIREEDQRLIAEHAQRFAHAPIIPVSSVDKEDAAATGDRRLLEASGFDVLERLLRDHVVGRAVRTRVWNVAQTVSSAVDQLERPERMTLMSAERGSWEEDLAAAKEAAEDYTKLTRGWTAALSSACQKEVAYPAQLDLRRGLREIAVRYERVIATAGEELDSLGQDLTEELRGLNLNTRAIIAERTQKVLQQFAETYAREVVSQSAPSLGDTPGDLLFGADEDEPAEKRNGLSRRFLGANALARHSLYGHQFFLALGPIGWAAGATLGSGILLASVFTQRKTRDQQQARAVLKRTMEIARAEIDADVRVALLDARQFAQSELQLLIDQRRGALDAEARRCERAHRLDEKDRKVAQRRARERLEETAVLRAKANELCRLAQQPLPKLAVTGQSAAPTSLTHSTLEN